METIPDKALYVQPAWLEYVKFAWNTAFVGLCVIMILVGVSLQYCILTAPPVVNFILLLGATTLLGYVEGLHYGVVSIEKWDMGKHLETYPRAVLIHDLCPNPVMVKRFLVGRQFLTIFVVFLIAEITTFPYVPSNFLGLPAGFILAFIQTGIPGIMYTLTFGQLIPQLFVEEFTLPFVNMRGSPFCVYLALFMEYIGVCHFSWLLYETTSSLACYSLRKAAKEKEKEAALFAKLPSSPSEAVISGEGYELNKTTDSPEEDLASFGLDPLKKKLNWFDLFKYCWSTFATGCSVFLVCYGISQGYATLPAPIGLVYFIFIAVLVLLFYLEGLMICIVATQYWDKEQFKEIYPRAYMLHDLVNRPENVKRFIIGRQFFTLLSNFLLAQVSTYPGWKSTGYDSVGFFIIVKSGLIGVLITLSFAQLQSELIAAEYPLRFMNMRGSYTIVFISLLIESIGIGHCAWLVYFTMRSCCCKAHGPKEDLKPQVLRVNSQEILLLPTISAKSPAPKIEKKTGQI